MKGMGQVKEARGCPACTEFFFNLCICFDFPRVGAKIHIDLRGRGLGEVVGLLHLDGEVHHSLLLEEACHHGDDPLLVGRGCNLDADGA